MITRFAKIAINPISGELDVVELNFSYDIINGVVIIPYGQQMVVYGEMDIEGMLINEGKLILEV